MAGMKSIPTVLEKVIDKLSTNQKRVFARRHVPYVRTSESCSCWEVDA